MINGDYLFCILFKIKGIKSQGCCYCDKCKLVIKIIMNNCPLTMYIMVLKDNKKHFFLNFSKYIIVLK